MQPFPVPLSRVQVLLHHWEPPQSQQPAVADDQVPSWVGRLEKVAEKMDKATDVRPDPLLEPPVVHDAPPPKTPR
eukprot:9063686-Karenia_brevis.AAC.1